MKIPERELRKITKAVLDRLQRMSTGDMWELLHLEDYHGFGKARFPAAFVDEILRPWGATTEDVQVELVMVGTDLRHEVHKHLGSCAITTVLGEGHHSPPPVSASAYLLNGWVKVRENDTLIIPDGVPHGFTVEPGGKLFFLSVQSEPIVRDGHDDYIRVET